MGGVSAALRVSGAWSGQGQGGMIPPHAGQRRNLWQLIVATFDVPPCQTQRLPVGDFTLFPPSNTKTSMAITTSKQLPFQTFKIDKMA